ncbi:unnamed protein product, partial [Musa textilis]
GGSKVSHNNYLTLQVCYQLQVHTNFSVLEVFLSCIQA